MCMNLISLTNIQILFIARHIVPELIVNNDNFSVALWFGSKYDIFIYNDNYHIWLDQIEFIDFNLSLWMLVTILD